MSSFIMLGFLRRVVPGFTVAAGLSLLTSCLPDPLEVDRIPETPVQMVVSSQIVPDESLMVLVTRTFGALDASDDSDPEALLEAIAVDDATVTVEGPGGIDTLGALENGFYGGAVLPLEVGATYTLRVKSASLGEVSATTDVKRKVTFEDVDAELYYNGFDDTLAQITYTIADQPEKNWYMITVQEVERQDAVENLLNPRAFTLLLDDAGFNGSAYGEKFRVFPRDYQPGDTIAVSLSNISEAYYTFMKLRVDNRFSLVEFVSEPVDYPSNVVGGRGHFNLYVPDVRFFVFD